MQPPSTCLICGDMKLSFSRGGDDARIGYQLLVKESESNWRAVSAAHNPMVRGHLMQLYADEITRKSEDCVELIGKIGGDDGAEKASWRGTVTADIAGGWFAFDIEVNAAKELRLSMENGFEPEITLDLGALPPYERGDHVWFMTQVANPTKWNDDAYGNDFPATYYFDPYLNVEVMLFFDMTRMSWMSERNIGRFLNYRCGFRRRYQPEPAGEVGLYATGFSGRCFPAGIAQFRYFLSAQSRRGLVDERQAVRLLVEKCLPLLPARVAWPAGSTSWRDFAQHCGQDLMTQGLCWRGAGDCEFILNYVDGYSPAWQEAIEARGNRFDMIKPCFDAAVWIAHPLAVLCRVDRREPIPQLYQRVSRMIERAVEANETPFAPVTADTVTGTWQHLYILEELFQFARLEDDQAILDRVMEEVRGTLIPLAKNMSYLFPLSFNRRTLGRAGGGDCHAGLGAYANFMLDLHENGETGCLEEAEHALGVLYQLPVNSIHQEVFLLAMGVQAAYRLAMLRPQGNYSEIYHYLLAQTLRMQYWYSDRTSEDARKVNLLGMFQACATISYPALFENIEVLGRLCPSFKKFPPPIELLRVFDHARKNNFYFFPRCFDAGRGELALQYVPFENIPILEGPAAGSVGQEIYGAGWVFRACLLWETFGFAVDRDIMVLNLDTFEERRQLERGFLELTFVVFNGTDSRRKAQVLFPWCGPSAIITTAESPEMVGLDERRGRHLTLDMLPGSAIYVRVSDELQAEKPIIAGFSRGGIGLA